MELSKRKALLLHILSLIIFGSNGVIANSISLTSYEIVWMRTFIGSIVLGILFFVSKKKPTFYKNKKQTIYLIISGVAMGASWLFQFEAYNHVGVSIATIIYYCGPVIVVMLSPIIFKERLTMGKIIGLIAVLCGMMLINGRLDGTINPYGFFCGIMSAVMYAVMVLSNKKINNVDGVEIALLQLVIAFVATSAFVLIKQGPTINLLPSDILPMLVLGVVNTGFTCYLYFLTIKVLPVQTVAIWGYVDLIASVIFAYLFLHEQLLFLQIIGGILIIGGAIIAELSAMKAKAEQA